VLDFLNAYHAFQLNIPLVLHHSHHLEQLRLFCAGSFPWLKWIPCVERGVSIRRFSCSNTLERNSSRKRTNPPHSSDFSLTLVIKQQLSYWLEILLKTASAMVVLPIPPMPHIPIMRASDDLMHKSVLSRSMRESIPTRPLESPNDVWFNFFKMNCTISLTSLDSGLPNTRNKR